MSHVHAGVVASTSNVLVSVYLAFQCSDTRGSPEQELNMKLPDPELSRPSYHLCLPLARRDSRQTGTDSQL
jgi:hypothetical protein